MSAPVARSAQSTATTSLRERRKRPRALVTVQGGKKLRPVPTPDDDGMPWPLSVAGPRDARPGGSRGVQNPADRVGTDVWRVDCQHDGVVGGPGRKRRDARPQRRAHPLGPVGGRHRPRGCGHVDDGRAEHHDDVVAPAVVKRGHRVAKPSPLAGKHLRHTEPGARARGKHDAADVDCHGTSVTAPLRETATPLSHCGFSAILTFPRTTTEPRLAVLTWAYDMPNFVIDRTTGHGRRVNAG